MVFRLAVSAGLLGAATGNSLISCSTWVPNSGTVCFRGTNTAKFCNPATFTNYDSCSEKRCCNDVPPPTTEQCMAYVNANDIHCNNGVEDRDCTLHGSSDTECSKDYCCKDYVRVMSNCWQWTSGGDDCGWPRKNGWEHLLRDYKCFEKVNLDGMSPTSQNGLGPCSTEQCCAKITDHDPQPDQICQHYPPHVPQTEKNYDWRCDCYAAAKHVVCPHGKVLQVGKFCTRYSGKYAGVPKCLKSQCCAPHVWDGHIAEPGSSYSAPSDGSSGATPPNPPTDAASATPTPPAGGSTDGGSAGGSVGGSAR